MRVLHLGKYWHKDGGIETHVKTLCKGLASRGIEVVNLVSAVSKKGSRFVCDGYTVVESPSLGELFSTSISPQMVLDARRIHEHKSLDLLHLHFPDPMSHLVSMALPKYIPRIITWHSDIVKQRRLLKLYMPFQLSAIGQSEAIIVSTRSLANRTSQIPPSLSAKKLHIIPFGFNFEWLMPTPEVKQKANAVRQHAQGRLVVFALGRHVPYKGFDVLINALRFTNSFLVLGGQGPITDVLKAQVRRLGLASQVIFTGRLNSIDLAASYHACDVFCLPSINSSETFGIVQVEAMACGKPVISTQLDTGVDEVNRHRITGLIVPPRDSAALAGALNQMASDEALRLQLGQQAKQYSTSNFSADKMAELHESLYESLLAKT